MRTGECRANCGACCKFVVLAVHPVYYQPDQRHWLELHGIRLDQRDGNTWATVNVPCRELTEDLRCGLFGTAERPKTCEEWPSSQADISLVNSEAGSGVCGYEFVAEPAGLVGTLVMETPQ